MSTELTIPVFNSLTLERLPKAARTDFLFWRAKLEPLLDATSGLKAAFEGISRETGVPFVTVKRRFYRFKNYGPGGLLERRLCGKAFWVTSPKAALPAVTTSAGLVDLWKMLCEQSHRSCKTAHKRLLKMWQQRDPRIGAIPEWRDFPGWPKLPEGFTYGNLMRVCPSAFELTAARQGRAAAALKRPTVFTTRVGLYVGSHYLFDDKVHDLFVNELGQRKHGRPMEIYSLDLFSACKRQWGMRVRTKSDEGKYAGLPEVMMRYVLAATLYLDGYSPRGTTIVAEAGTAKVRDELKRILAENWNIIVHEGAMKNEIALLGQYPGLGKGNPRHKAALESNNNLEHNRFDFLPGQTGKNVAERPEELAGRLTYNATLLAAYDQLPPEKQALLEFPILELNQFIGVASHLYANIRDDRDHRLENWVEAGNITQAYEFGGASLRYEQLTLEQRRALPQMIDAGLVTAKPVRMTRGEVWNAGSRDLIKIPGWGVAAILGDDLAREVTVKDNMIETRDPEIGPETYRYEPLCTAPEGGEFILDDNQTYQAFINPFAPDTLFVRTLKGQYLGECRRITAPCRTDIEGIQDALARASRVEGRLLAPMRARHAEAARERLRLHRNNAAAAAPERNTGPDATAILNGREDDDIED